MIKKICGLEEIEAIPDVEIRFHIYPGDKIKKHYPLGNIMFDAKDCEQVCEIIEQINRTLKIIDESGEDMIIYFTDYQSLKNMQMDTGTAE